MEPFADAAAEGLADHLSAPFAFFGHSMGAALAFEVTRRLMRGGGPLPLHLFVSGRRGPRTADREKHIHQLPRDEFIEAIRGYSGTPEEVLQHEELMELVEPLLRADFSVSETYEYTPDPEPLPVPMTALGGVRDEDVSEEELAAWEQETAGPFRKVLFDGGHFFLTERRDEVLDVVRSELDALLATR
jgi:surfactin synthase thioesterase subunit